MSFPCCNNSALLSCKLFLWHSQGFGFTEQSSSGCWWHYCVNYVSCLADKMAADRCAYVTWFNSSGVSPLLLVPIPSSLLFSSPHCWDGKGCEGMKRKRRGLKDGTEGKAQLKMVHRTSVQTGQGGQPPVPLLFPC